MFGQVWAEETRSIILWFGLSRSVSLTPWTMTFTSTPQLFSSLLWRCMSRGFEVWFISLTPSPRRLWWSLLPCWVGHCYEECSWLVSNGYFSPLSWSNRKQFFSDLYQENLLRILGVNTMIVGVGVASIQSLGIFNLQVSPHSVTSNSLKLPFKFQFVRFHHFLPQVCWSVFSIICNLENQLFLQFRDYSLSHDLNSVMWPRMVIDF